MPLFGTVLKELRSKKQISQRELARLIGVTAAYISDIEKNHRNAPSKDVIRRLAAVLNTEDDVLFDLAGQEPSRIPPDVPEIIKRHPETVSLLRAIQRNQISVSRIRELTQKIGGGDMKALILAAGLGSRMKHMTQELPKCIAIVFNGKTLLQTQLESLRACGLKDIAVVRGYKAEKIDYPGLRYHLNADYEKNNILESLFCAEEELNGDIIVSYSDIWYQPDVVKRLMRCEKDIVIGVDIDWKEYYLGRKNHPIEEAENVIFGSDNDVVKIGKIGAASQEVHGEFIGMMKLTARGCEILKKHYHRAKALHEGKRFQRASLFKKAYLTDLLQDMADFGVPIHCEIIGSGWKEIDTIEDFENAVRVFEKHPDKLKV